MSIKLPHSFLSQNGVRAFVVASLLELTLPRVSRAEDSISYMHQSYQESEGRINVESEYAQIEAQLPKEVRLKLTGVIDTISGATPTGELDTTLANPVVLSEMHERRKAWHLELDRQFKRTAVTAGFDDSRESDYHSQGYSLNTVTDFNDKNTSLILGASFTDDTVKPFGVDVWRKKRSYDAIVGVTQLLNPNTTLTANLTAGHSSGFMIDPYKVVQTQEEILDGVFIMQTYPENRPTSRDKVVFFLGVNHAVAAVDGAVDASYRFYHDTYGVNAHTVAVQWIQNFFDGRLKVIPSVRFHQQGQADFYYPDLSQTSIVPSRPQTETAPWYSSDYRLSKMDTWNTGLKVLWEILPQRLSVNAAYDRYEMKGRDGVTPAQAYVGANVISLGLKYSW